MHLNIHSNSKSSVPCLGTNQFSERPPMYICCLLIKISGVHDQLIRVVTLVFLCQYLCVSVVLVYIFLPHIVNCIECNCMTGHKIPTTSLRSIFVREILFFCKVTNSVFSFPISHHYYHLYSNQHSQSAKFMPVHLHSVPQIMYFLINSSQRSGHMSGHMYSHVCTCARLPG